MYMGYPRFEYSGISTSTTTMDTISTTAVTLMSVSRSR
jgi:hypothetical protein